MKNILLTGVTGAIGSMHLLDLLSRGYNVTCLVRGNNEVERFNRLAAIVGSNVASRVRIINGDVTQPRAGIDEQVISELKGNIDIIIHHAGSIKFDRKYQEEIIATNVGGTANMLALAQILMVRSFCYDSTAYALNAESRNPYEESKKTAEAMVLDWHHGRVMVWRPSIVLGRGSDGVTNGFSGYYGFLTGFYSLKQILQRRWEIDGRDACLSQGFEFSDDGNLHLLKPIYVDYSRESTLNLITVDWAVASMTDLMEKANWGTAHNVVNSRPPRVAWCIERSLEILDIHGVRRLPPEGASLPDDSFWKSIQQNINKHLDRYWSYINREIEFVSDAPTLAPTVDLTLLKKMLAFAVKENFGRKKQT